MAPETIKLPVSVTSPGDVNRLLREVEAIDERFLQLRLRKAGTDVKLPKTSQFLEQAVTLNGLNLLQPADRLRLRQILQAIKERAPVLHMSFGADPSADFMTKLVTWLRQEIHPFVLVTTGLQPNIGAGCVMRTNNHSFDFSLARNFARHRDLLLNGLVSPAPAAALSPRPAEAAA
ncbi:MAG TPA: hypothetical protein VIJ68_02895 [Candidatus Saccharimonadales bacterium]